VSLRPSASSASARNVTTAAVSPRSRVGIPSDSSEIRAAEWMRTRIEEDEWISSKRAVVTRLRRSNITGRSHAHCNSPSRTVADRIDEMGVLIGKGVPEDDE
jgi:hypothetical protein